MDNLSVFRKIYLFVHHLNILNDLQIVRNSFSIITLYADVASVLKLPKFNTAKVLLRK
jgi:hypothetical protein